MTELFPCPDCQDDVPLVHITSTDLTTDCHWCGVRTQPVEDV